MKINGIIANEPQNDRMLSSVVKQQARVGKVVSQIAASDQQQQPTEMLTRKVIRKALVTTVATLIGLLVSQNASAEVFRGEVNYGSLDSSIGDFIFDSHSKIAGKIFSVCKMGDQCEVTGTADKNKNLLSVQSVKKLGSTPSEPMVTKNDMASSSSAGTTSSAFDKQRDKLEQALSCGKTPPEIDELKSALSKSGVIADDKKMAPFDEKKTYSANKGFSVFGAPLTKVSFYGHPMSGSVGIFVTMDAKPEALIQMFKDKGITLKKNKDGAFVSKDKKTRFIAYVAADKTAGTELGCYAFE